MEVLFKTTVNIMIKSQQGHKPLHIAARKQAIFTDHCKYHKKKSPSPVMLAGAFSSHQDHLDQVSGQICRVCASFAVLFSLFGSFLETGTYVLNDIFRITWTSLGSLFGSLCCVFGSAFRPKKWFEKFRV